MRGIFLLFAVFLVLALSIGLLTTSPTYSAFAAHPLQSTRVQPTPDANEVLNRANEAVQAAQNDLSVANLLITFLALMVGIATLGSSLVSFVGLRFLRQIQVFINQGHRLNERMEAFRVETVDKQKALLLLSLADQLISEMNINEAVEIYRKASNLLPDDGQVNYILGRIYSNLSYYDDAIRSLSISLLAKPDNPTEVQKELGLTYRRRGEAETSPDAVAKRTADYDKAIEHLKLAINGNPSDAEVFSILGELFQGKGEYKEALEYYKKALQINPNLLHALCSVAVLSYYLGQPKEASKYCTLIEALTTIHTMNRQLKEGSEYCTLALAQLILGKMTEARESFKVGIKLTTSVVQLNSMLDNLYLLQKTKPPIRGLNEIIKLVEDAKVSQSTGSI